MSNSDSVFKRELGKLEKLLDKLNKKNQKSEHMLHGGEHGVNSNVVKGTDTSTFGDNAGLVGGASHMISKKTSDKRGAPRTFKVILVDGRESNSDHHAELYEKTKDGKDKKVSITSVARKMFRQLCRSNKKKDGCRIKFTLIETTRVVTDEGHLVKYNPRTYFGNVHKKKTPVVRTLPDGRRIANLYDYTVSYISMDKAGVEMKGGKKNVMNFYA